MLIRTVSPADLQAAYAQGLCPICALNERDERRYIDTMFYDQVTNVTWRAQIRDARGFCAAHTTRILVEGRSALGVALIADDLLKTVREALGAAPALRSSALSRFRTVVGAGRRRVGAVRSTAACPLCLHLRQQTPVHIRSLLQDLANDGGRTAYTLSPGLCVAHLVGVLDSSDPPEGIPFLIEHQQRCWQRLNDELQEFIRKSDYQFAGEPIGEEGDAWRRAFRLLAGWQTGQQLRN
ncbi:MAG: hypothetical protein H0X37_01240 [Herpetosiphonaceae bacterium]|nr:hypothetical protein [Herpetosiphonaceae bacterium]